MKFELRGDRIIVEAGHVKADLPAGQHAHLRLCSVAYPYLNDEERKAIEFLENVASAVGHPGATRVEIRNKP